MPPLIHPVISGMFVIPLRLLEGRIGMADLRRQLTTTYFNSETGQSQPVRMYRTTPNYVHVPREWARERFPDLWAIALDRCTHPQIVPNTYPKEITPRDADQAAFMAKIIAFLNEAVFDNVIIDLQINAKTGTGKTVAFIKSTSDMQISPLGVIVHRNRVKEQWRGSIEQRKGYKNFFGIDWVDQHVGIVQQDECDFRGKSVVIMMGPSLVSRQYDPDLYTNFGVICIDEVHKFATPMLNQCLPMFNAAVRIPMTATEKLGNMGKVITAHVGRPRIISTQEGLQPIVVRIKNQMQNSLGDEFTDEDELRLRLDNKNAMISILAKSRARNDLLARIIHQRGYQFNRNCLAVSDRTDQLLGIRKRLIALGVPAEEIGLYVGAYRTGKYKASGVLYRQDGSILKRLGGSPAFTKRKDAEAFAVAWSKREDIKYAKNGSEFSYFELQVKPDMCKPSTEEYDRIENHCRIVLATYGIFDVAIDISRLDWGIELTPRGDVTQVVGRTLRLHEDKPPPVWNTMEDRVITFVPREDFTGKTAMVQYIFQTPPRLAKQRLKSYAAQNATFKLVADPHAALEN